MAVDEAMFVNLLSGGSECTLPVILLHVRREHILEDSIAQLAKQRPSDLKKQMKVGLATLVIHFEHVHFGWGGSR